MPFPATQAERKASGDPRRSIEERYPSKEDYLRRVKQAAEALVEQGYLLAEDLPTVTEQASQCYDLCQGRVSVQKEGRTNALVPPLGAGPQQSAGVAVGEAR
jgi:Alpha/beta hydrolase domain